MNRENRLAADGRDQTSVDAGADTGRDTGRRKFLNRLWILAGVAAAAEFCWVCGAFLLSRRKRASARAEKTVVTAGGVEQFAPASVTAIPQGGFFLSRLEDGGFLALSRTCTHLGCSVTWNEAEGKFVCPCHGSSFNLQGEVLTSPAPRPLDCYPVRIENGIVKVEVSVAVRREHFEPDQATRI